MTTTEPSSPPSVPPTPPEAADEPLSARIVLRAVLDGLRGRQADCTRGSLHPAIIALAIPMMLEMVMESVFAVCDIFFVAHLGSDAITAVGLTETMMTLVYAVAIGLSMAATATVARRIGENRKEDAGVAAVQAILVGVVAAAIIGAIGALQAPRLLRWMGAEESVVGLGSGYTAILLGTNVAVFSLFLLNAVFRGAGDASIAMRSLWIANGCNIVLDYCLIFGKGPFPELGLEGAAIATSIGRSIGVLYQLWFLIRGTSRIHAPWALWRPVGAVMMRLLRVSLGGIGQYLVGIASWILLARIVILFGTNTFAGYTIAVRVIVFAILPAWGLSNAAATMVGQNLGAGQPDRAERAVWNTGVYNMVFLGLVTVLFLGFGSRIVDLFLTYGEAWKEMADGEAAREQIREVATTALRIISYGYVFYAWEMVTVQSFNGAGDTTTPTVINVGCFWLFQVPLGWFLAMHTGLGASGVFWAVALSYSLAAVVAMLWFRRGSWRGKSV